MPNPGPKETRTEWIKRCMADEESRRDFPDGAQRFAFCDSRWKRERGKQAGDTMDPMRTEMHGTVVKVDEERRIAYGWFSVIQEKGEPVVDSQGDVIKEDTLLTAAHDFVLDSRAGKVMHKGRRVADVVESIVLTRDVQKALGVELDKVGWFGAMKFRDEGIWKRVKAGELQAFSVGGTARREEA